MRRLLLISMVMLTAACGSSMAVIGADGGQPDASVGGGGGSATGGGGGATGGGGGATGGGGGATGGGGGTTGGGGGATGGGGGANGFLNGADTCATAPDVTAGGTFNGTTDDAGITDDYGPSVGSCPSGGAASGRDVAYALSPAVTTNYTVTVTPLTGSFDPLLYAQESCGTNTCVAGTTLNGPGQPESITFSVAAGQMVYVIVDGENVSRGPFEITIQP